MTTESRAPSNADTLEAYTPAGVLVASIDISGPTSGATGVFIKSDGSLYISKDGTGVWLRTKKLRALTQ